MRTSSPRSTSCCPASDVKFVARTPALGCGPLSALCAQPVWGEQADRDVWGPGMHRSMRLPPWRALYTLSYRPCALFPATT